MMKNKNSHEFKPIIIEIQESPLNPLGRLVFWIIVILFLIISAVLIFAKTDIVVSGYGNTFITGDVKRLKVLIPGLVSKVYVDVNSKVSKGEKLVEIDSTVASSKHKTLQSHLDANRLEISLMQKLISGESISLDEVNNDEIKLYFSERELLNKNIDKLNNDIKAEEIKTEIIMTKLSFNADERKRTEEKAERLKNVEDLIEKSRIDELDDKLVRLISEREILVKELEESTIKINTLTDNISNAEISFSRSILERLIKKKREVENIVHELNSNDFNSENHTVVSPVDGYVNELMINTQGSAVSAGEEILTIVPAEGEIKVKAKILNRDIGYIEQGQECEIKVETFPFQKYGTIKCEVESISKDSMEDNRMGKVYELIAKLEGDHLARGSETYKIQSGMNVTIEVKSGKRRIIEFLTNPIVRGFDEGLKVR